jgi:anti-sigma regulatory factor (Ser/Thr protein kinase)
MPFKKELSVISLPASISQVTDELEGFCKEHKLSGDETSNIVLATDEGITNIIIHAYDGKGNGKINVSFEIEPSREKDQAVFRITLIDNGRPVPSLKLPISKPDVLDDNRIGGFGLFLIDQIMDNFEFQRVEPGSLNRLIMEKKIFLPQNGEKD